MYMHIVKVMWTVKRSDQHWQRNWARPYTVLFSL